APDQAIFEIVYVPDHAIGDDGAVQVTHDLVDVDDDASVRVGDEASGLDARIDHRPLARPVRAHRLAAVHVAALHPVGPLDVGMHGGQGAVDVARVERLVCGGQQLHSRGLMVYQILDIPDTAHDV